MNYKKIISLIFFILFPISIAFANTNQDKKSSPSTELKVNGFEKQDSTLITNLLYSTGWFGSTTWSEKTKKQGVDISIQVSRKTIELVEIHLKKKKGKKITLKLNVSTLYGQQLATKIVNKIGNELFGKDKFNSLASSKLIFSAEGEDGKRNIYTVEINGKGLSQKTYRGNSFNPTWVNSKKQIFYNTKGDINTSLIIKNIHNNKHRLFSYFNGLNSQAEISPNGNKLVLCLDISGTIEIVTMDIKNENFQFESITSTRDIEFSPTWSPNGKNICFAVSTITKNGKVNSPKLKIINIESKKSKDLFPNSKESYYDPSWNKKGLIAYSKTVKGKFLIAYYNPLTKEETEIKVKNIKSGSWINPSWAPDNRHIVCVNQNDGKLYILDSWTNKARLIPLRLYNIKEPQWSSSQE